jgi:hypothetical protein
VTSLLVDVGINPLATIDGGTFQLILSNATGAVFDDFIADALVIPSGDDGDAIPAAVELLAPNEGDGNLDGILDMRQPYVVSLASGTSAEYLTIIAPTGSTFTATATRPDLLDSASLPSDVSTPFGQLDFTIATVTTSVELSIDFQFGIDFNSWYQFGLPSGAADPEWFEFLAGNERAELIDMGSDGLIERVVLHLTDGGPGDLDGVIDGSITVRAVAAIDSPWPRVLSAQVQEGLSHRSYVDQIIVDFDQRVNLGDLLDTSTITQAVQLRNLGVIADAQPEFDIPLTADQFRYSVDDPTSLAQLVWSLNSFQQTLDSLPDGYYRLVFDGGQITNLAGLGLDGDSDTIPGNDIVLEFHRLAGDVNGDRIVSDADMQLVIEALGSTPATENWNPNADLDRDGAVTVRDRLIVFRADGNEIIPPGGSSQFITLPELPGDFNQDGLVSGGDFLAWQRGFGITGGAMIDQGDANGDLNVDGQDSDLWQQNFGQVTEPQPIALPDLPGDFNQDGLVSGGDFLAWQRGFGITGGATIDQGDANGDLNVDGQDSGLWQQNFGQVTEPQPIALPE